MARSGDTKRIQLTRRRVVRREVAGLLLWVGTVGVVYGTLALPFHVHLILVFLWLVSSGVVFVALTRLNLRDTELVFEDSLTQIADAHEQTLMRMAVYSEARDAFTGEHLHRVRLTARQLARALGRSEEEANAIGKAAIAHDLGKIGVPDAVLGKPGKLTPEEFAVIKTHAEIGEQVLAGSPLFELERLCARHHHERWDGSGYPDGLAGEQIPLVARITAVADVFDALTSRRPYKDAWPADRALEYLVENSGSHFDPAIVEACRRLYKTGEIAVDGRSAAEPAEPVASVR